MSEPVKPFDAGDEAQVKAKQKKNRLAIQQRQDDLKAVMGTPAGRRHIWHVLEMAGVYSDTGHTDPVMIGRFLGRRSLGNELLAELVSVCLPEYLLMESEARNKQQKEDEANG